MCVHVCTYLDADACKDRLSTAFGCRKFVMGELLLPLSNSTSLIGYPIVNLAESIEFQKLLLDAEKPEDEASHTIKCY